MAMQTIAACPGRGAPEPAPRAALPHPFVLEQSMEHRWLNGAQKPEFTPFGSASSPLQLDLPEIDRRTGHRTIRMAMGPRSGDSATLTVRANGSAVRQEAWLRAIPSSPVMLPGDSARLNRFRLLVGGHLMLPVARVWDLVPQVHPRREVEGASWTDTITLATEYEGSQQTLTGMRRSFLVGDSAVAGHPVWIIRDSAQVRYTERELQYERT